MFAVVNDKNHVHVFCKNEKLAKIWMKNNKLDNCRITRVRIYDYEYHRFLTSYFGRKIPREYDLEKVGTMEFDKALPQD